MKITDKNIDGGKSFDWGRTSLEPVLGYYDQVRDFAVRFALLIFIKK